MSFTVFLGNLPAWVTADDIKGWLNAENLVADAIKVIRNPETQESKGFAFIEAPNHEEMNSIIRRFDRAPLEDRLLRANPAQPPKPKGPPIRPGMSGGSSSGPGGHGSSGPGSSSGHGNPGGQGGSSTQTAPPPSSSASQVEARPQAFVEQRPPRRGKKSVARQQRPATDGKQSAFAEELAKAL